MLPSSQVAALLPYHTRCDTFYLNGSPFPPHSFAPGRSTALTASLRFISLVLGSTGCGWPSSALSTAGAPVPPCRELPVRGSHAGMQRALGAAWPLQDPSQSRAPSPSRLLPRTRQALMLPAASGTRDTQTAFFFFFFWIAGIQGPQCVRLPYKNSSPGLMLFPMHILTKYNLVDFHIHFT